MGELVKLFLISRDSQDLSGSTWAIVLDGRDYLESDSLVHDQIVDQLCISEEQK